MNNALLLLGRLGLAAIFVSSGLQKIGAYAGMQQYMESTGVPGLLLPLVIALEVIGGLAIASGLFTRWAALALAGFSLAAAAFFHADFAEPMQAINFWKNVAIAGGFLVLAASNPGAWSLDHYRQRAK